MQYQITDVYETRAGISVVITPGEGGEDTKTLLFKPSFWLEEGLSRGDTLEEEGYAALCATAQVCRAIARAEGMLAASDYSRTRLIHRLMRYGLDRAACECAADYMIEKGYIRENEQTLRITRFYCKNKHWGKKRIAAELMGRGYGREAIHQALNSIGEEEYYASLLQLVRQKYAAPSEDKAERERRIAALSRMGFSLSDILRALREAGDSEE